MGPVAPALFAAAMTPRNVTRNGHFITPFLYTVSRPLD
jgi:hypothetical protein